MATDWSWPPMHRRGGEIGITAVRRFERELGSTLPDDYRRFLLDINGGRTASSHRTFTIRRGDRVGETTLNTLHSLDAEDDSHDLRWRQRFRREEYPDNALRIGYDDSGNAIVLVLSGEHRGELWMLTLEDPPIAMAARADWFARRDAWKLADSFLAFVGALRPID